METGRERLKNLLSLLLEVLVTEGDEPGWDRPQLREMVLAAGYEEAEAAGLVSWLEHQWTLRPAHPWRKLPPVEAPEGDGMRLFGEDEREFLEPSAFGYLLALSRAGQISPQQLEAVIHYASLISAGPLKKQEVDHLLDQVFLVFPESGPTPFPADDMDSVH